MMPQIFPIVAPQINWFEYVDATNKSMGRSPTRNIDFSGIRVGGIDSFLMSLMEFEYKDSSIIIDDNVLEHISFSFLCIAKLEVFLEIKKRTKIITLCGNDTTYILTANMQVWKNVVMQYSKSNITQDLRIFFNSIYLVFCQFNLQDVWVNCRKNTLHDNTIEIL
jgi:hypothetical protein